MYLLLALLFAWAIADPVVVPPSTNWDGNDGPWSSFTIQVGTPPQAVRIFPSSSGSTLWAVVPEGCTTSDPTDCASLRGGTYDKTASSTWLEKGLYALPLSEEEPWGYAGNGEFGYDQITLSYAGGGGPTLNKTIMGGIATKDFFVGTLGLTPWGVNFTDFNYPVPSILSTLKNSSIIESNSWSYTAGAYWTAKETYGTLIFGGYDRSRFEATNLSFTRGEDISRDLLVGVQSITTGTNGLLPKGIVALVDSTVAQIWLPLEACRRFEEVFGLIWDEEVKLYLVNDTLHQNLQNENPTVTFTLGSTTTSSDIINVKMPYGAFDLTASWPLTANGTSKYFPLRRADNSSQYVLGRTFLQSAYLIVDYDQNNFTVAQALYPDTNVPQEIVSINHTPSKKKAGLGPGAIAGIAVGGVAVIAVIVAILWWTRTPKAHKTTPAEEGLLDSNRRPELAGTVTSAYEKNQIKTSEIDGVETPTGTLMKTDWRYPQADRQHAVEAGGYGRSELAGHVAVVELSGRDDGRIHEME